MAGGRVDLRIEADRIGNILLARVEGQLDLSTAPAFRAKLDAELDGGRNLKNLVLNLSRMTFIDSSGLGVILGRYKRISERGGRMVAAGMPNNIMRLFELSGMQKIIPVYRTEAEALKSL